MKMLYSLALVAALAAGQAHAACTYPKAPEKIPDGGTSTLEQMLEWLPIHPTVSEYVPTFVGGVGRSPVAGDGVGA
jgi:hypothetical protein